jgi:hypothetical protein
VAVPDVTEFTGMSLWGKTVGQGAMCPLISRACTSWDDLRSEVNKFSQDREVVVVIVVDHASGLQWILAAEDLL